MMREKRFEISVKTALLPELKSAVRDEVRHTLDELLAQ